MLEVMQQIPARLIKSLSFSSLPSTATLQEIASSQPKGVCVCVCVDGHFSMFALLLCVFKPQLWASGSVQICTLNRSKATTSSIKHVSAMLGPNGLLENGKWKMENVDGVDFFVHYIIGYKSHSV
jgi:hypothetical protein